MLGDVAKVLSILGDEVPRRAFDLKQVVEWTGVDARQIRRWADADVVPVAGGGSQGLRREYTLRTAVLIQFCDRLQRMGFNETGMRALAQRLNLLWDTWTVDDFGKARFQVLWVGMTSHAVRRYDARIDLLGQDPRTNRGVPLVTFVNAYEVAGMLNNGYFGFAIPIADIVTDLEAKTGHTLS